MKLMIRAFRENAGISQTELGKRVSKSLRTIQSWESGTSYPNAEALCELCDLFGTDPNTMLGWYDDHPKIESTPLKPDEADMLDNYRSCTPEWRKTVAMTAIAAKGESLKSAECAAHADNEIGAAG